MTEPHQLLIDNALLWFKELLRFDTSNPPGNESPAIKFIASTLKAHGIESKILAKTPSRPNLFCQIPAVTNQKALLLSSHVDVVPVGDLQSWTFPPFSATEHNGMIWGRGTIDMKFKTAFDMAAMIFAKDKKLTRPLKMLALADEETGSEFGSAFVLNKHFDLVDSEFVLNESGGMNLTIGAQTFIMLQAGEKSCSTLILKAHGLASHGSIQAPNSSIQLLSKALGALSENFHVYHLTESTKEFLEKLAEGQPPQVQGLCQALLHSSEAARAALIQVEDLELAAMLHGMLFITLNPTILKAGVKTNIVPESAEAIIDCRLLPGQSIEVVTAEISRILESTFAGQSKCFSCEVLSFNAGYESSLKGDLYKKLSSSITKSWSTTLANAQVIPFLMPASSDNSHYARSGIQPIGFAPLLLPSGYSIMSQFHAVDERIPVSAFREGLSAYLDALSAALS